MLTNSLCILSKKLQDMPPQNLKGSSSLQKDGKDDQNLDRHDQGRICLANPAQGEEVVISGMAGRFPASDDIYEYRNNLLNKKDMTSSDARRSDPKIL